MCLTSLWFSTKRHTRLIYYELKWIIPATLELNCWECCWMFEVFVELWPESLAFLVLITNSLLTAIIITLMTWPVFPPPPQPHQRQWAKTSSNQFSFICITVSSRAFLPLDSVLVGPITVSSTTSSANPGNAAGTTGCYVELCSPT